MTNQIEFSDFPADIENFFRPTLNPLKLAIGICEDDYLNFKFKHSNILEYSKYSDIPISAYEIPSLMRVLLTKSNIINEDQILQIFSDDKREICYILEWGRKKIILIFSLIDAKTFVDIQFSKDLTNKRDILLGFINSLTDEGISNE